jgi:nitrate reductase NapE component
MRHNGDPRLQRGGGCLPLGGTGLGVHREGADYHQARKTKKRNMKKNNLFLIFTVIAIVAVAAFGAYRCGLFTDTEPAETEWKGDALTFGSASDTSQGLYDVSYHVVNRNNAVFLTTARFYWPNTPDLDAVKEVVRIPQYLGRRHYRICEDCPISVRVLRQPVPPKPPVEERPEKQEAE